MTITDQEQTIIDNSVSYALDTSEIIERGMEVFYDMMRDNDMIDYDDDDSTDRADELSNEVINKIMQGIKNPDQIVIFK